MHLNTTRREFLARTSLAALAMASAGSVVPSAFALEPFKRSGKPKLMPSLAAYSFRQYFKDGRDSDPKTDPARRIDMLQFIDYCAEQECAGLGVQHREGPRPCYGAVSLVADRPPLNTA